MIAIFIQRYLFIFDSHREGNGIISELSCRYCTECHHRMNGVFLLLPGLKVTVIFRLECDLIVSRLFSIRPKLSAGTIEQRKCRVRFVGEKHVHAVNTQIQNTIVLS